MPCFPFTGKQMGAYMLPQIGTGGWVEFEQGNPDYPIWSGCWYGLAAALFEMTLFLDLHRLPELVCGFSRRRGAGPTLYPVACAPQAWATGVPVLLLAVMLGGVCHDFGKPATTAFLDGRIRSIDHEEQGVAPASAFLDRLNVNSIDGYDVRRQVLGITAHHLKPGMWFKVRDEVGDGAFRRLAQKVDLELLARLAKADCMGRAPGVFNCDAMDWFLERARSLGVEHRPPAPILLGRHLVEIGVKPGPRMGQILKAVYEQQLDGAVTDLGSALAAARAML